MAGIRLPQQHCKVAGRAKGADCDNRRVRSLIFHFIALPLVSAVATASERHQSFGGTLAALR